MDAEDPCGLSLVVSSGDEDFLDVIVFQFAQGDERVAVGGDFNVPSKVSRRVALFAARA